MPALSEGRCKARDRREVGKAPLARALRSSPCAGRLLRSPAAAWAGGHGEARGDMNACRLGRGASPKDSPALRPGEGVTPRRRSPAKAGRLRSGVGCLVAGLLGFGYGVALGKVGADLLEAVPCDERVEKEQRGRSLLLVQVFKHEVAVI